MLVWFGIGIGVDIDVDSCINTISISQQINLISIPVSIPRWLLIWVLILVLIDLGLRAADELQSISVR